MIHIECHVPIGVPNAPFKIFMKTISQTLVFLRVLLVCVPVLVNAAAQSDTVQLRFVSFPKAANPEPIELLVGEEKTIEVEIPTNSISKVYEVPRLSEWVLGKSSKNEENEFVFEVYGKAVAMNAAEQIVLVFRKGGDNASGLDLTPMRVDDRGLGGGKYLVLNASKVEIAGSIGTGKFQLKPKEHGLIGPKPTKTSGTRKYAFAKFYYRSGEEVQPFFSSTWRFNDKARSLVFFYHDPGTNHLRVHTIRSFVR